MISVDVVINAYNYESFIGQAIESVVNQTYLPKSIIIVDDGSKDRTLEIILEYERKYPLLIKVVKKQNGGQLSAINAAAEYLSADLVALLDADDWWDNEYLSVICDLFAQNGSVDVTCSSYKRCSDSSTIEVDAGSGPGVILLRSLFLQKWFFVPTSGVSFRRLSFLKLISTEHEYLFRTEADAFLLRRAAASGMYFLNQRKMLVNYRDHGNNLWLNKQQPEEKKARNYLAAQLAVMDMLSIVSQLPDRVKIRLIKLEVDSSIKHGTFFRQDFVYILDKLNIPFFKRIRYKYGSFLRSCLVL